MDELSIAWVSDLSTPVGVYMAAMDLDSTPGSIQMSTVHTYLEERYGKQSDKDAAKNHSWYWGHLGFIRPEDSPWLIPDEPSMSVAEYESTVSSTGNLLIDLSQYVGEHVHLANDESATGIASWILASAVPELSSCAPPLLFMGTSGAGKSRAIRALSLVCRRAMYLSMPSAASLYHVIHQLRPTVLIDEWANVSQELRYAVENVIRCAFTRGTLIPRVKDKDGSMIYYDPFAYFGIGSKLPVSDDVYDRCYPSHMIEDRNVPDLPLDSKEARELRTMVLRFRLETLARTSRRQPASGGRDLVKDLALKAGLKLGDRALDKATPLAAIASAFDVADDIVEMIALAQERSAENFADTIEAVVFRAVKALSMETVTIPGTFVPIYFSDIRKLAWNEFMAEGLTQKQIEAHDPVKEPGKLIRGMGFKTERMSGGNAIRDPDLAAKLARLEPKYGTPSSDSTESPRPSRQSQVPIDDETPEER